MSKQRSDINQEKSVTETGTSWDRKEGKRRNGTIKIGHRVVRFNTLKDEITRKKTHDCTHETLTLTITTRTQAPLDDRGVVSALGREVPSRRRVPVWGAGLGDGTSD